MKHDEAVPTQTLTSNSRLRHHAPALLKKLNKHWRTWISGCLIGSSVLATVSNGHFIQSLEHEAQSLMWELRGPVQAPEDIVILTIDEESLSQGQHYLADPENYPELEPIASWPWPRTTYADAIRQLLDAGASAIALDILLATPSSYGTEDDMTLAEVLKTDGENVVLAAQYGNIDLRQGNLLQPTLPLEIFRDTPVRIGAINFVLEPNDRIHRLSRQFLDALERAEADLLGETFINESGREKILSFAEATLTAADLDYRQPPRGNYIFFHGPARTFEHVPFWSILDEQMWTSQLDSGRFFQDKIVLIGSTATLHQDFHPAPFSKSLLYPTPMPGVEILANTVATLRQDLAAYYTGQSPWLSALIVGGWLSGMGLALSKIAPRQPGRRLIYAFAAAVAWGGTSFVLFLQARIFLPVVVPITGVLALAAVDFTVGFIRDQLRKKELRNTLARYVTSPIVQEIISQQDDLQDLLAIRKSELLGTVLSDRYRIVEVLGSGGFGDTYLARDLQRPGDPICVVKQLKIVSDDPKTHRLAQRLFQVEAETLETLGEHDQIPRLLAYFESNYSFYLVQEMIQGVLLKNGLKPDEPMSQRETVEFLLDILPVIQTVHEQNVIHRDIKPSNIIRRHSDGHYVLIDFGAVKQISNQLTDTSARVTSTVGIGTQGYMPSEQAGGLPNFSSDLYALGITAIEALTGLPPHILQRDARGEVLWTHKVEELHPQLANIIQKMIRYDFRQRYQSASLVLEALGKIDSSDLPEMPTQKTGQSKADADDSIQDSTAVLPSNWAQSDDSTRVSKDDEEE